TRQLLAFSRRDVLRLEVIDPNRAIDGFRNLLQRALGERIELELALSIDSWLLQIDRTRLEAALLNLAVNARDAMPLGGTLRIATRNAAVECPAALPSQAMLVLDADAGDYVEIEVRDSGTGMPADVLRHAFEPFFTTKDVGLGSGLGLSQVYGFVRQSGGFLTAETALDRGTVFRMYLPRSRADEERKTGAEPSEEIPGGSETILVVEDNELVLELAVSAVAELGYRVLLAGHRRGGARHHRLRRTDRSAVHRHGPAAPHEPPGACARSAPAPAGAQGAADLRIFRGQRRR